RASRVLAMTSRHRGLFYKDCFGETPKSARGTRALPGVSFYRALKPQCVETMGPVSQPHAHPANRPTSRLRDETVLLFRSIPSSNSIDRKFRALLSATPAKLKS